MATVSLTNQSLISPLSSASFTSSKPKPSMPLLLTPSTLRFHGPRLRLRNPVPEFSCVVGSSAVHKTSRSRFVPLLAARDSASSTESLNGAEQNGELSLKSLIKVYKEAILEGDENTVSAIESRMDLIGNDKDELVLNVSTLTEEIKSGKEKYIRLQADFDNFRKRTEKDRLSIRTDAQGEVIESLLAMVDNFERAKQQLKPETDKEKKIDASYQGIYKQFVEIMRSLRVAVVPTVGKPFDPALHEAIAREESQEFKEGIIIQEFRRGFLLGDRLLRPATVKVSLGPGRNAGSTATSKSSGTAAAAAGIDER
ncbi:GrpE nucleotide exchange factor [Parasponia andersonii]|uniref:GrpE protein homolog n=1 Tax=Parasponia andersonii TaxID=3476 RepID=A0A2P5DTN7_PARAD|nr:GrpE nucleotide exchange factor [Parasponia andersonii]